MNENQLRNRERYITLLIGSMLEGNDYELKDVDYAEAVGIDPLPDLVAIKTDENKNKNVFYIDLQWVASEEQLRETLPVLAQKNSNATLRISDSRTQAAYVFAVVLGKGKKLYVSKALKDELMYDESTVEVQALEDILPKVNFAKDPFIKSQSNWSAEETTRDILYDYSDGAEEDEEYPEEHSNGPTM